MKKLLSFLLILQAIAANAYDAKINGIYYDLNHTDLTATVTDNGSNSYSNSIIIPNTIIYNGETYSVTSIGDFAFSSCFNLTSLEIPNSVTSMGKGAIYNCTGLTSIYIPKSVVSMNFPLRFNTNLVSIIVEEGNPIYDSRDNCNAIIEKATNELKMGCKNTIVPYGVLSIGKFAFESSGIQKIDIPNSVNNIEYGSFEKCSNLITATISSGVIGNQAFMVCSNLTSVTIGKGVTSIGTTAFGECPKLKNVYCYTENIPTATSSIFYNSSISTAILYVPAASLEVYSNTAPWSGFGNIVAIEPPQQCATPIISFANGKLVFECETEGVEFVPSISLANMLNNNQVELFSVYRFSVYAKKEGYLDSDVASVNIDLNKLKGDMNNDGNISIADVVALVNIILGGSAPTLYYSVGTDAVTADNYTTANNAQQVSSLSAIPSTLLTVTTPGVYYILLPDQFEPEVGGVVYFNVTKLNVNIPGYSVYRTASLSAGVQIKRVNVGTSGSQIDYE